MAGSDLLVKPVVAEGATVANVYFPGELRRYPFGVCNHSPWIYLCKARAPGCVCGGGVVGWLVDDVCACVCVCDVVS